MVCSYCGGKTRVINSRSQKRNNQVWRRRQCLRCQAIFTTHEAIYLPASFSVDTVRGPQPFAPDKLFAEMILVLQDRKDVYQAAREITDRITQNILKGASNGLILRHSISLEAARVLKRFDKQASLRYVAEHPSLHG